MEFIGVRSLEPDRKVDPLEQVGSKPVPNAVEKTPSHWRVYAAMLAASLLVALLLRSLVVHAYRIPSASMETTLLAGDYLLAERVTFGAALELPIPGVPVVRWSARRGPKRGEVVIFQSWDEPRTELVKRCVALAGDTVEVANNVLTVNGELFDPAANRPIGMPEGQDGSADPPAWDFGPHVVSPRAVFVMGDNRGNSQDSRLKGDVPISALRGRPLFVYWSVNLRSTSLNPFDSIRWSRIGKLIR